MRAIMQEAYGGAEVLRLAEVAVPAIKDDEVLVHVHAAGLDRGTWHLMTGYPRLLRLAFGLRGPRNPIPGLDLAGTVAAIGPKVTRFAVGDEVFGTGRGSFAEFAAAAEGKLAHKPAMLTFEQAAVLPVSGLTALQAVCNVGQVREGQQVLILGASGGVGSFAVPLATHYGAHVTGVCSASKADLVRSLGAHEVLDYAKDDFAAAGRQYDVILDIGGGSSITRLRNALTPRGTLVIIGAEGGSLTGGLERQLSAAARSPFVKQRLVMLVSKENAADLERLAALVESGALLPTLDRVYPLAEAAAAMRRLEQGLVRGKVAIAI